MQYCSAIGSIATEMPAHIDYGYRWVRLLTDIPAAVQEIRAGITTPRDYLKSLKGKTTFSVLNWRDPLPTFGDAGIVLLRVIRSKLKKSC
jgi:predicted ATP-grasp superfamily ATP-dependent carboligase